MWIRNVARRIDACDNYLDTHRKHTLTVNKADPFTNSLSLHIRPLAPDDLTVRVATVRVHFSYKGKPAGMAVRRVALGDATLEDAEALKQAPVAPLHIAPSTTPVDLTIRIARRDESDAARELLWTPLDCADPIALPNAPMVQKVGDRDTASSFAAKVTSRVDVSGAAQIFLVTWMSEGQDCDVMQQPNETISAEKSLPDSYPAHDRPASY